MRYAENGGQFLGKYSQTVGQRKRCCETAIHKVCNVTHFLLAIGKDVMRLPFIKCAMSLTSCWS